VAKKTFTIKQIMAGFSISDMTAFTWRKGTANRDPIPHTVEGRTVSFPAVEVKAWAKKYGLAFDSAKAEKAGQPEETKPGPKKTTAAAPAAKKAVAKKAARAVAVA
jgi:hypothetical protein